jgi:predicted LPLAT superfamily acyltransferase
MAESGSADVEPRRWRDVSERGTRLGIKAVVVMATVFGRGPARLLGACIALYYTLTSRVARETGDELRRRLGLPVGFGPAFTHVRRFAHCTIDALFFLRGKTRAFRVTRNGKEHLQGLRDTKRGAVLLGAHLGSFYAMRMQSTQEALPLYPVVYTKHARLINDVLESLDPGSQTRLIEMGGGDSLDFMLKIRERVEEGGLVAILGDRPPPDGKTVEVDFLGGKVALPAGPYILAASLRCPVYFTAGLYRGGNHYELFCVPFADSVVLPRGDRQAAIARYAQQYADLLEEFVRKAPDNWFNFFDFWAPPS